MESKNLIKKYFEFFFNLKRLKEMPRTGWVLRGVKNPETVAEHSFGLAFLSWILGSETNLNVLKLIKIALSHDLCEVFAGDRTPFWYYPKLPKEKTAREKILEKWARLPRKSWKKIARKKRKAEKKALLKLLKNLDKSTKNEIFHCWIEYESSSSEEGKFVRQLNRVETLIQAIDYFGEKTSQNWWEWPEEIAEDKIILEFLDVIEEKFYKKEVSKKESSLKNILDVFWKVNQLKKVKKGSTTVASHSFEVALMSWIFGKKVGLNMDKIIKMALCHQIHEAIFPKEISKTKSHQKEEEKVKEVIGGLKPKLSNEIFTLWKEFQLKESSEAHFLSQLAAFQNLLEILLT